MIKASSSNNSAHIGILLTGDFSLLSFSSLVAPLRMANLLSGRTCYRWTTISCGGQSVTAGNGLIISADASTNTISELDALFVCGSDQIPQHYTHDSIQFLQSIPESMCIGASCSATYLLARAGLMDGYRCTIHWEHLNLTQTRFPGLRLSRRIFEIDRNRYTCAGGKATLDMMLSEIRNTHGPELSAAITEQLVCDRQRDQHDSQSLLANKTQCRDEPRLGEVISLMEANIEEPMTMNDLSHYTGMSRKQLERLFRKHMDSVPSRFYMQLRLEKARQLLLETAKPISAIAAECGFISSPHFSKSYRQVYGLPPRADRCNIRRSCSGMRIDPAGRSHFA